MLKLHDVQPAAKVLHETVSYATPRTDYVSIKCVLVQMRGGMAGKALRAYYEILDGERNAKYLGSKSVKLAFRPTSSSENLWKTHSEAMSGHPSGGGKTLLDLKTELGRRLLRRCRLCERMCDADRALGERGHCGVLRARISSDFVHMGEEPDLVPSYTIFFAGCTLDCVFCQNWDISTHPDVGVEIPPSDMAKRIEARESVDERRYDRVRNVNWVGGEPTSNLPYILEVLSKCNANLPQVWNSNMYMSQQSMNILDGIVDVYLTDFKYGNDKCASRLSNAPSYMRVVKRNHLLARANGEMIVRHLVLPGHLECCTKPVLSWIAEHLKDIKVNVMAQYRPEYRANDYEEIARPLSMRDYQAAVDFAESLGLDLCD